MSLTENHFGCILRPLLFGLTLFMYYGWKIVAALFIVLCFSSGLGFYIHAVMLQALVSEKGFSVTEISAAVSIFFCSAGIAGLGISVLIERFDIRFVMIGGALLASTTLSALGFVSEIWHVYGLYILFGIGFSASGLLPATTLVARWFVDKRALALSVSTTGLSVGGILVTPMTALLIERSGLEFSTPLFGLAYVVGVVPLVFLVIRPFPADTRVASKGDLPRTVEGTEFGVTIRSAAFWGLSVAWIFVMLAQVGGIAHQYGLVTENLSPARAAIALSVLPMFSVVGRIIGGLIVDKMSGHTFSLWVMLLQGLSLILLAFSDGAFGLFLGLALLGITVGNLLMLQPLLIADVWGLRHYSRIYATSNLLTMLGIAVGPVFMGYLLSETGNYTASYLMAGISSFVAIIVFYLWGPRPIRQAS
jgi:MFS family permease